jgi:uncharacterized membrane protein YfcA
MMDYASYLALVSGVFAGAVVSGFAGFAFSAVAGIVLLHLFPPAQAVPLMMMCSIAVQSISLVTLRDSMRWRDSLPYLIGGAAGIPPALYLLQHGDPYLLRAGFGLFIAAYAAFTLMCPSMSALAARERRSLAAAVGFAGGFVGGFTAMPGAIPTIWCNLRGISKKDQRGLVQPYITIMQGFAIALLLANGRCSPATVYELLFSLPALAAGTAVGIFLFSKASPETYRRLVLMVLVAGGVALVL